MPAEAVFDVFEGFEGPFAPSAVGRIARNRAKNIGNSYSKINFSFDWFNPSTGRWENIKRLKTAANVGPGQCAAFEPDEDVAIFSPDCEYVGEIWIRLPAQGGTYYFGLKCWADDEVEPEYPTLELFSQQRKLSTVVQDWVSGRRVPTPLIDALLKRKTLLPRPFREHILTSLKEVIEERRMPDKIVERAVSRAVDEVSSVGRDASVRTVTKALSRR